MLTSVGTRSTRPRDQRPDGLRIPLVGVRLDDDELYSSFWQFLPHNSDLASKVRVAIRWLSKAWLNTPAVDMGDRFVFLKTGFEALLGSSRKLEASKLLRNLFEHTYQNSEEWELKRTALLWKPSEKRNIKWREQIWKPGRYERVTPLQHWFLAFSEERNRVIHEGSAPRLDDKRRTRGTAARIFSRQAESSWKRSVAKWDGWLVSSWPFPPGTVASASSGRSTQSNSPRAKREPTTSSYDELLVEES